MTNEIELQNCITRLLEMMFEPPFETEEEVKILWGFSDISTTLPDGRSVEILVEVD